MLARNWPKGKEPILTMAMQITGGRVEQWPFSVGEVGFFALTLKNQFQMVIVVAF